MAVPAPFVRVVVLNFDGWQLTIDCLRSLQATRWPADRFEIVLVDNGSVDDVVERVRDEMPGVRIIEPLANTGFAGGCNLGIRAAGEYDVIALVNNDATVAPDWLAPLVNVLDDGARIGAACPKILFDAQYVEAELSVPDARPTAGDPRTLGVRVTAARVDGGRADRSIAFDEGFFSAEDPRREEGEEIARWSWRTGHVRVRGDAAGVPSRLALRVVAPARRHVSLRTEVDMSESVIDAGAAAWVDVALDGQPFDVINNAGSSLYPGGFGGDRGFLERDRGQYDVPAEVFAWCGGGVVLSKAFLADVGLFDERLFLYYEDTDLSWRGRLRGWRYMYEPASLLRHRHAASSGVGSKVFKYYTERNRPLMLAKNAPARIAWQAGTGVVKRGIGVTVRDMVLRPLTLRMPVRADALHHRRVMTGYLRLLPRMLGDRWRSGRVGRRRALMAWTQVKDTAQ